MLAGAGIGLAMLVRRLRSGSKHERRAAPDEPASTPESHGGGSAGDKSGLSRKLGGFVALVVTTLALRALRKRLLGGSDGNR